LWKTAKPWLERWMSEQVGWRGFVRTLGEEAPYYATLLPQLPRLLHQRLNENPTEKIEALLQELVQQHRERNGWLMALTIILAAILGVILFLPATAYP
jgi:ubiquinone biosynthesis protein